MKKKIRVILLVALGCLFAVSAGMLVRELVQYREGEETYAEAEELADLPDFSGTAAPEPEESAAVSSAAGSAPAVYVDPYAEQLRNMDFTALREVNSEILGWILIPNTVISYPMLQTGNNTYYLTHTWRKNTSVVGGIFLECQNSGDFSDFNTILYGHNMNNGSMFGTLKKYKSLSYWKAHPTIYITDQNGSRAYRVFAAYEVSTEGTTYQIGFSSDESRQKFIDYCLAQSLIDTGLSPTPADHIVTLSTCTGHGHATRWVVQAVLKSTAKADAAGEQAADTPETPSASQSDGRGESGSSQAASSSQAAGSADGASSSQAAGSADGASSSQTAGSADGASSSQAAQSARGAGTP